MATMTLLDLDDEKWEETFMDNLEQEEIADTTEDFDISPPSPKLRVTKRQIEDI